MLGRNKALILGYSLHGEPCRLSLVNLLHGMIQLHSLLQDAEIYVTNFLQPCLPGLKFVMASIDIIS